MRGLGVRDLLTGEGEGEESSDGIPLSDTQADQSQYSSSYSTPL